MIQRGPIRLLCSVTNILPTDGSTGDVGYSNVGTGDDMLYIGGLLQIDWMCSGGCDAGSWSLETAPDIVERVQALLGPNSFDHLAISIFQVNKLSVYDFDFTILPFPCRQSLHQCHEPCFLRACCASPSCDGPAPQYNDPRFGNVNASPTLTVNWLGRISA